MNLAGLEAIQLPVDLDTLAPDGSEIRFLKSNAGGSMVHCTLQAGQVSMAVKHRTVEEIWYFVSGIGEVWRRMSNTERVDAVCPGTSLTIPLGAHFQFRNTGDTPLMFVLATIPQWPGDEEAVRVTDFWPL